MKAALCVCVSGRPYETGNRDYGRSNQSMILGPSSEVFWWHHQTPFVRSLKSMVGRIKQFDKHQVLPR
jgi:hypothetical protein